MNSLQSLQFAMGEMPCMLNELMGMKYCTVSLKGDEIHNTLYITAIHSCIWN